jgi:hypothetical protein
VSTLTFQLPSFHPATMPSCFGEHMLLAVMF